MSVKIDPSGRRSIQVEVEVPGTPEEVWQAIATGPGISSWFVPTESEEREGGALTLHFGPGMDSKATLTAWAPPHRFAAESDGLGPNAPPMATEWTVEARSGGTCMVRVVHSLFASGEDWDDQLTGMESGWPAFFRILRLYLTHYRGQRCGAFQVTALGSEAMSKTWDSVTRALGLAGGKVGERRTASAGAPPLAGVIEEIGEGKAHHAVLMLDEPAPGAAILNACGMGDQVFLSISFYLYGDRAAAVVARDEPLWNAWMKEQLAPVSAGSNVA